MVKRANDTDLRNHIEKIVRGYKPQTPGELALEAAKGICKSPFTEDILKAKKPVKFTQPKFKLFEGTTDLIEHIYHFQQQMVLEGDDEALLCKLFPSSLSGSALIWFRSLKPRFIGGFTQLCEMFISQYICNQKRRKNGVIPGTKMHRSLVKTPPVDMRELMARADGIIRLEEEELTQSKRATSTIAIRKPSLEQKVEMKRYSSSQEPSNGPKQSQPFTRLTVSLAKLFHENKGKGIFRTPPAIHESPEKQDMNKMCAHHNDFGHTTDDCQSLKYHVETMLRKGMLSQYPAEPENRASEEDAPSACNAIMGRNWIHRMDGEASTRCQEMRCISEDGRTTDPPEQEEEDNSELLTIEPFKEEVLDPSHPDRKVLVGSLLYEDEVDQLRKLFRENKDGDRPGDRVSSAER
ncbi:unnamed protein product [Prunus brigantina]